MDNVKQQLRAIRCFVLDVDGVLTNGHLFISEQGHISRAMNIKDGYAIQLAVRKGYKVAVISGGHGEGVTGRMQRLGVTDVFLKAEDKDAVLQDYLAVSGLEPGAVLYMGDDLPDLTAMKRCGVAAAPADAAVDIREISHYVSPCRGGEGCVRDVIEQTLRLHGDWE